MKRQARGSDEGTGGRESEGRPPRVRVSAVLSVAAALGVVVWQALAAASGPASPRPGSPATGSGQGSSPGSRTSMRAGSEQQLVRLVRTLDMPVYWHGPQPGSDYAVTRTRQGWVYVSYLPPGAPPPTGIHEYPSVVTYPFANAYPATQAVARRPGSEGISVPAGEVAFYYRTYPTSAYLAFSGARYQVEVFDPIPSRVRSLVSSGQIRPVPAGHP